MRVLGLCVWLSVLLAMVGCSSQERPEDVHYFFDPNAPVPDGELREQADHIVHVFRPASDIVEIKPYETFALGTHLPFIVDQVRVVWRGQGGRLHDVLFRFDSSQVGASQRQRLARFIQENRGSIASVRIEGRTDSTGSASYNVGLSARRAEAVASELVALGIPSSMISKHHFGESAPIASNRTASGRQRNRSGRVILSP